MNTHSWFSWLLFVVGLFVFAGLVGFANGDLEKILTRQLYVLLLWVNVSVFAFLYNGITYNTWKVFSEDKLSNSIVFGSLVIATGYIIGSAI